MADSGKGKNKKTLDNFADDLDAMLDGGESTQQVGLIDDDDAIDRMLMSDSFQSSENEPEPDDFADIDALIGNDLGDEHKVADLMDEFEDLDPQPIINAGDDRTDQVVSELDEFGDLNNEMDLVNHFDEIQALDSNSLEEVVDTDAIFDMLDDAALPISSLPDEIENMAEIDEFTDLSPTKDSNNADFLMADFDISADDDFSSPQEEDSSVLTIAALEQPVAVDEAKSFAKPLLNDDINALPPVQISSDDGKATLITVDHSAELAALATQITVLKKQQLVFKQEMTERVGKDELAQVMEPLGDLETEQKKIKRTVEAVSHKMPVAAYVANGLALIALLIGTGLGFQGYIAKSQVAELSGIVGKLQEQITSAPAGQAADNALLRKEFDALTVANGVYASQIAEINKTLQGDSTSTKTGGDFGKKINDLNSQNMQIGAELETLQTKVSALEKSRMAVSAATTTPKPEKKKPPVVVENWAVNLIAFKQDWYAKRKADEFAAKGVAAKVSKTETKGEVWYRLSVDGFKSQYEAAGYAAKVKKSLNLDSVWITRNKDSD